MRFSQKKGQMNCNYLNASRKRLARKNKQMKNLRKKNFNESKYRDYTSKRAFVSQWKCYFPKATLDRKWNQMKANQHKKVFTPSPLQETIEALELGWGKSLFS
jgi:hypothetical protein